MQILTANGLKVSNSSAEVLRLALELGSIGVFCSDLIKGTTVISRQLCCIVGIPETETIDHESAMRLIHVDDRDAVIAATMQARAREGRWSADCRVVRPDGTVRWVSILGRRHYDAEGVAVASIGTVLDVTGAREAKLAVDKISQRLHLALDAAKMGTFEVSADGDIVSADQQMLNLLGWSDAVGPHGPNASPALEQLLQLKRCVEGQDSGDQSFGCEVSIQQPGDGLHRLSIRAQQKESHFFAVAQDVTRQRQTEEALRASDAQLRVAVEAGALGVFQWFPDTDVSVWENERMYELLHRDPAAGPLSLKEFLRGGQSGRDGALLLKRLDRAIKTRGKLHIIGHLRDGHSSGRWLQVNARVHGGFHEPTRVIGVVSDISSYKRLRSRAHRLELALNEVQETERRNIAQELHDSTVQHLVAASLMLKVLKDGPAENREATIKTIEESLGEAMKEIRTFSYLMHPPVMTDACVSDAIAGYVKGFASRTGLKCTYRCDRKISHLPDAVMHAMFRVLQEALGNAHKHARATKIQVHLRKFGKGLHLVVIDDGKGVQKSANARRLPANAGVGWKGMAMRAKQFGGRVSIRADADAGVTVHAFLPRLFCASAPDFGKSV
jgi:PAS domain S-box-containing protein